MWSERSAVTNAVIVGALLAALAGVAVLAWAVASPAPDDEPLVIEAITNDHLVYLLGPDEITVVDPETRETVRTIATEYNPEITIAPDGTTIYLTDRSPGSETLLSVIDTHTWQVVDQLPAPHRIANIGVGSDGMAVSADGRYVYIHKWKILEGRYTGVSVTAPNTDNWWDIYDTATQEFSDTPPHVPNCGGRGFPPLNGSPSLAVLCHQRAELVFLDAQSGEVTGSISFLDSTGANTCDRGDTSFAAAPQAPDGTIYLVTTDGCVRVIDPVAMAVTDAFTLDLPEDWRVGFRMVTLSPSGDRLLLGIGPGVFNATVREAWEIEVASQSLLSTVPIPPEPTAWSLAVSPDGSTLYVVGFESHHVAPAAAPVGRLTAFDIATGEEAWRMTDLNAPEVVRVAPRP